MQRLILTQGKLFNFQFKYTHSTSEDQSVRVHRAFKRELANQTPFPEIIEKLNSDISLGVEILQLKYNR